MGFLKIKAKYATNTQKPLNKPVITTKVNTQEVLREHGPIEKDLMGVLWAQFSNWFMGDIHSSPTPISQLQWGGNSGCQGHFVQLCSKSSGYGSPLLPSCEALGVAVVLRIWRQLLLSKEKSVLQSLSVCHGVARTRAGES